MVHLPCRGIPSCEGSGPFWGGRSLTPHLTRSLRSQSYSDCLSWHTAEDWGWSEFSPTSYFSGPYCLWKGTTHFFSRARLVRVDWLFLGTEWNVTLGCSVTCSPSGSSPRTCGAFVLSLLHYHIIYFISENTCSITTIMAALMHTRRRRVKNKIKQNMELSRKKNVKDD